MRIAITRKLPFAIAENLRPFYREVLESPKESPCPRAKLGKYLGFGEAAMVFITDRIDEKALKGATELKIIFTYSVGVDHVDLQALAKRGIALVHTPNVLTDATSDLAFALILHCARDLGSAASWVKKGKFKGALLDKFLGKELAGATLGIVGMGRIGQAVAKRALAFGMHVTYSTRPGMSPLPGAKALSFEEVLRQSDVLSLHCPLNEQTRHLIGKKELELMKDDAILVNTARGPVIDESALINHLKRHPDFKAGLDVYEREPKVPVRLLNLPNVVCVPHIGSATYRARKAMADVCVQEAVRFAKREPLRHLFALGSKP